nr:hypothetical protein BaRGS_021198 [Batillaria attramentaria]
MFSQQGMQADKGWAWAVLAASSGANFLNGILVYFVGVVHAGLLKKFQSSVTTTAWVGAIYSSLETLGAPLASVVISRFGCRVCCVVGGVLCFTGFTASAFVTSIEQLFFTYGLLAGFGLAFQYSPTNITVGFYFDKLRGLASGLSLAATAVGVLSGSVLTQILMDEYSVSGAFLLIGAVSLHFSLCGMFYRPSVYEGENATLDLAHSREQEDETRFSVQGVEVRPDSGHVGASEEDGEYVVPLLQTGRSSPSRQTKDRENIKNSAVDKLVEDSSGKDTLPRAPTDIELGDKTESQAGAVLNQTSTTRIYRETIMLDNARNSLPASVEDDSVESSLLNSDPQIHISTDTTSVRRTKILQSQAVQSALHNDLERSKVVGRTELNTAVQMSQTTTINGRKNSCEVNKTYRQRRETSRKNVADTYRQVLRNKAFTVHCGSILMAYIHIAGVYLHLPEYAMTHGTAPTQAAALFVAVGIFGLLGRTLSGFASTEPSIDPLILEMGGMGLCGVTTILFPLYSGTYVGQMVFAAMFGLYTGPQVALMTVLTVRFVGVRLLATGFGVMIFTMGVGYIAGPPLAGLPNNPPQE